jgi:hypothetical protein
MQLKVKVVASVVLVFCLLTAGRGYSEDEVFRYDLTWLGFKAGEASLRFEVTDRQVKIISRAESAPWISIFYRVDDRAESILGRKVTDDGSVFWYPVRYRLRIREGRHRRDKEVIFYDQGGRAVFINHLDGERKEFDLPEGTFDPLSAFFLLRRAPLEVGVPVISRIFDSKKVWDVEVKVLRKEELDSVIGKRKTLVLKPELKSEGIFLRKGDIFIYLTDDEKRIPVMLRTKVLIGSVVADMTGGEF